jgi:general secretion pathway protein K
VPRGLPPARRNGFALIVVLNVVVILSAIAIFVSYGSREEAAISANFRTATQRESLAEGAMILAAYRLLPDPPERDWLPDGRPYRLTLFGTGIVVSVQDESGKLSLNTADETTLSHAFANAGLELTKAQSLAAAIVDWRDPDDNRHMRGAERQDYLQAGIADSPENAPFRRTDELLGVLGMSDDSYRKISPIVSAYSMDREVNLEVAPPPVLAALFGSGSPEIAAVLDRRGSVPTTNQKPTFSDAPRRNDVPRQHGPGSPQSSSVVTTYTALISLDAVAASAQTYYGAFRIVRDRHGPRIAIVENIKLIGW